MLKTQVEIDNLENEIKELRKENERLKQELSNYNRSTIHNTNGTSNDIDDISEYEKLLQSMPNYFENSVNEIEETKLSNDEVDKEFNRVVLGL